MPEAKQALKDGADVNWVFPGTLSAIIDARQPSPKGRKLTVSGMRSSERRRPAVLSTHLQAKPLHCQGMMVAAFYGHRKMVRFLLKNGAQADQANDVSARKMPRVAHGRGCPDRPVPDASRRDARLLRSKRRPR
jgi:hypothetical protein